MKATILFLIFISMSQLAAAEVLPETVFECRYQITNLATNQTTLLTGNLISSSSQDVLYKQLTLEPLSTSEITISARAVLFRYLGDEKIYFPMELHPRGNTVNSVAFATFNGADHTTIEHTDENFNYRFTCE